MPDNPVKRLLAFGQSAWLDDISRGLIRSGELESMIERWGLRGITSNPAIFAKAITAAADYDEDIAAAANRGSSAAAIYEQLTLDDVRAAADLLAPVYSDSRGGDGYVSLEVSPHLVHDTEGTIAEAHRLWAALDRPNVMLKVPATDAGLAAIEHLLAGSINVNATLLFSLERYRQVANAYLTGVERARAAGRPLDSIASVASFFLSRIDVMVDPMLERIIAAGGSTAARAGELRGQIAVACARRAYAIFEQVRASDRYRALERRGACMQRPLWASTGTKNPNYDDIKYIEPLIGPQTVSTMPLATLRAYERHGEPAQRVTEHADAAAATLESLQDVGVDLGEVTARLLEEGIEKFVQPFDTSLRAIDVKRAVR